MAKYLYDSSDKHSIYEYASQMEGKTFKELIDMARYIIRDGTVDMYSYENKNRKGGLGELIEEAYFNYKPNNNQGPDFEEAGLELKVTPYKINKNQTFSSKERMIITMINYFQIVKEDFHESMLWKKSKDILIIFYLWESNIKSRLDYRINYVYLYTPPKEDLKIIIEDYNKIRNKIIEGRAHEISEGDTMYLGASTKASSSKDRTIQPFSDIEAKPRAFSFKNSYMTYIFNNYVIEKKGHNKNIRDEKILTEYSEDTFENYILKNINKNVGMKDTDLFIKYYDINSEEDLEQINKSKGRYSNLAFRMLGIKSNNAEEFKKANVVVKSIRVEETGNIIESLSFPAFKIKDLVEEEWQSSETYNYFVETKFLFMIYKKKGEENYYFEKGVFWNMPVKNIENELKEDWSNIVNKFKTGIILTPITRKNGNIVIKNNLPKKSEQHILHVRPHAQRGAYLINGTKYGNGNLERDSDELPNGDKMTKQCFWINNNYLKNIVDNT